MLEESRGCAMCVRALAGSRLFVKPCTDVFDSGEPFVAYMDEVVKSPSVAFLLTESEKRGFHFSYKSIAYVASH